MHLMLISNLRLVVVLVGGYVVIVTSMFMIRMVTHLDLDQTHKETYMQEQVLVQHQMLILVIMLDWVMKHLKH